MKSRLDMLQFQVAKFRRQVEDIARIQEELVAAQAKMLSREAKDKIANIIRLNRDVLANMKRSLEFAEAELQRAERNQAA